MKLRLERNRTPRPRPFRSHGVSSAGGGLKPPGDAPSASESSLPGACSRNVNTFLVSRNRHRL